MLRFGATHAVILLISCWVSKTEWGVTWLELNWQNFEIWQWRTFNEFQVNKTFSIPNWDQKEFKKIIRKIFVLIELEMDSFWLDSNFIPKNYQIFEFRKKKLWQYYLISWNWNFICLRIVVAEISRKIIEFRPRHLDVLIQMSIYIIRRNISHWFRIYSQNLEKSVGGFENIW